MARPMTRGALPLAGALLMTVGAHAQQLDAEDFSTRARAALGSRGHARIELAGRGFEACVGQAWAVTEGWARWELLEYRRVTDYDAGTSSHDATRRAGMDAGRAGGCGAQPDAAPAPQRGSITAASSWAEQLPIWLTPHGFLELARAGEPTIAADGDGWRVTLPVTRNAVTYTLIGGYDERFELESIRTWIDDSVFGDMEVVARFGRYRAFGALRFPERITLEQGGHTTFDLAVDAVALTAAAPEPPAARRPGAAGAAGQGPAYTKIGDGIFVMLGAYQSVAVEFDEFSVVIDGMQNDQRIRDVIRLTREAIPSKPIRYAVVTHSHFDHASGLRQFAADGTTILTHAMNVPFFEKALAARRTLDGGASGEPDEVDAKIQGIERRFVIGDDAGQSVELHPLAPSPHAADMLIAYLPSIKTVVESDLLQPWINPVFGGGRDGPHPYLVYLYEELERAQLGYEQFVPVHVPPEPPTMPRSALVDAVRR
jgi:glyoxylase-like metal-dependent hydrolase (beta-lactamase superfamily II)